jgi:ribosomal protein S18 acetylase RimI-like enzyme
LTAAFQLRLVEDSDEPFLYHLFANTRGLQFQLLPLDAAQLDALVRMQFDAQRMSYRQQYPASEHSLILLDGQPAGRLWINDGADELWVIDLVIHPAFQHRGLGRAVLEHVVARAESRRVPVGLYVDPVNDPALGLYRSLGFEICGNQQQMYVQMRRASRCT